MEKITKISCSGSINIKLEDNKIISNENEFLTKIENETLKIYTENNCFNNFKGNNVHISNMKGCGDIVIGKNNKITIGGVNINDMFNSFKKSKSNENFETNEKKEPSYKEFSLESFDVKIKKLLISGSTKFKSNELSNLKKIDCSGSCNIEVGNIKNDEIEIDSSGSSKIIIKNSTFETIEIDSSGSSNIVFDNVQTDEINIDCSGVTNISGSIKYKKISKDISGIAKIYI
jgi:hypothetical protein